MQASLKLKKKKPKIQHPRETTSSKIKSVILVALRVLDFDNYSISISEVESQEKNRTRVAEPLAVLPFSTCEVSSMQRTSAVVPTVSGSDGDMKQHWLQKGPLRDTTCH